ncbi:MAG: ribosome small subunit-dependent GTPase A [Odoribacter sp.]|nr:ribosome small subunit-dependent GTPase A [Odoribacter sp.]
MKKGFVVKSTGSWYLVRLADGDLVECRIRGRFRMKGIRTTNPVAVGDVVAVETGSEDNVITAIEPRRNYIIRRSTNLSKESHIIASNVDQAMLIVTVNHPVTSPVFIDRFLASAEAYNIPAILIFNKSDIYDEEDRDLAEGLMIIYRRAGYSCHIVSAATGENMEAVRKLLQGKTTVLSGLSGVGKSTFINCIEPGLHLKTAAISDAHDAGRHTTTFAEMFSLDNGGFVIDTPGVRSFGMVDMKKEEISHFFPEIFACGGQCRFSDCTHTHEPGCAVREAVETGEVSESRYASYLSMLEESGKYR